MLDAGGRPYPLWDEDMQFTKLIASTGGGLSVTGQFFDTGNVSGLRPGIIKIYAPVQDIRLEMDNAIKGIPAFRRSITMSWRRLTVFQR